MKYFPYSVLAVVLGSFGSPAICTYKYYKNKRVKVFCKDTEKNRQFLQILKKRIEGYSPTFYLPFAYMKCAIVAGRTVDSL